MPDWTLVKDRDGNKLYFDKNGKIYTSGEQDFEYRAVSIDGIEYYLNQGIELIREHHIAHGLTLLKSILVMPVDNNMIYEAQKRARKELNYLIKKQGERYGHYNREACVLLFRKDRTIYVINDLMDYSFSVPENFFIIKKNSRDAHNYSYYGFSIGIGFSKVKSRKGEKLRDIDLFLAVDSEAFSVPVKSIRKYESHVKNRLGADSFKRGIFEKSEKKIIYSFKDRVSPYYAGFDAYFYNGRRGYHLRMITSRAMFDKHRKEIIVILKSFKV